MQHVQLQPFMVDEVPVERQHSAVTKALAMPERTWLLHLSDIHFNKKDKTTYDRYDLDADLRDQLELDVKRLRAQVGCVHGIVVTGDIAFAGREPEYDAAFTWLRHLSELCGCPPEAVWCVPGNHDVDRSVYNRSFHLRNLHEKLRAARPDGIDAVLKEALDDSEAASTLFRPLEQYNHFASKFRCPTHPSALFWEQRLALNDGSSLVLRGTNSVLVSNASDNNTDQRLVLGTLQAAARQRAEEAVVLVCHHPLDWLMDYDNLIPILNARARVQLFGHKHLQAVDLTNNCLRIVAGSVQPDRREPRWRPRYNCLGFSVSRLGDDRKLDVDLYPRVWSQSEPRFEPDFALCDGAEHKAYHLDLQPWESTTASGTGGRAVSSEPSGPTAQNSGGAEAMKSAKTLTYRFLSLSHLVRLQIAQSLGLLREEDEGLFDAELLERILQRAHEEDRLAELWDRIDASPEDKAQTANPYERG